MTAREQHALTVLAYLELAAPDAYCVRELQRRLPGTPGEYVAIGLADLYADGLVEKDADGCFSATSLLAVAA